MKKTKLTYSDFVKFKGFPDEILQEVIREGEADLQARLQTANASDQRTLNILGFQVAVLIASIGGIIAIIGKNPVDKAVVVLGLIFIVGIFSSIVCSYLAIMPKIFAFPGNRPDSWMVDEWHNPPNSEYSANITDARVEQCFCLYSALYDNSEVMEDNANLIKNSLSLMMVSGATCVIASIIMITYRVFF